MTDESQKKWTKWFKAVGIRALYTFLEAALGFLTVGAAISEINWKHMLSVSAVAAIISIVKSLIVGLPELEPGILKPKEKDEDEDNDNEPTDT